MSVQRFDRLLARTDPFDLAQAIEAHVRSLRPRELQAVIDEAQPRMNAYYRSELERIADDPRGHARQQAELTQFLKSNLRAIPLFPPFFAAAILDRVDSNGAVAIGEETPSRAMRAAVVAGAALALVITGAAGEHIAANARMAAQTPAPFAYIPPAAQAPATSPSPKTSPRPAAAPKATPAAAPSVAPTSAPPTAVPATAVPVAAEPVPAPAPPTPTAKPGLGQGVATVTAPPDTPTPEPSDLDVDGMPESYSDATPLPEPSGGVGASVSQRGLRVVTPKPSAKPKGWVHSSLMHLDPFKPDPRST